MTTESVDTLVVRDDRLGDLLLTLPALAALARRYGPVAVAVSIANADLLAHDSRVAGLHILPAEARSRAFRALLRRLQPRRVVFFRSRFPLAWVAWAAGVPTRVGALANLDGLALSHRRRQHRSQGRRSEAEFGLELASLAGAEELAETTLELPVRYRERARRWIDRAWRPGTAPRVAVHPGSGASARNWSEERYSALVCMLVGEGGIAVLVTGAPGEEALARRVAGRDAAVHVGWAGPLAHAAMLGELDLVISGSTGTMHLAAAVDTATLSLFTAIRAESPRRWGALGARATTVRPEVPDCVRCVGERCPVWDCMERISVEDIMERVREHLR